MTSVLDFSCKDQGVAAISCTDSSEYFCGRGIGIKVLAYRIPPMALSYTMNCPVLLSMPNQTPVLHLHLVPAMPPSLARHL